MGLLLMGFPPKVGLDNRPLRFAERFIVLELPLKVLVERSDVGVDGCFKLYGISDVAFIDIITFSNYYYYSRHVFDVPCLHEACHGRRRR